jgi:5-methylcytosine-specific restriction endonuclease McrA
MAKFKNIKTIKKRATQLFQLYVRLRDTDENGNGFCCSCSAPVIYNKCDGGHFVSRTYLATLFDERNVFAQCKSCNNWQNGNGAGYADFLIKKYGPEEIERLNQLRHKPTKYTYSDYEVMIEDFNNRIEILKLEKGIE